MPLLICYILSRKISSILAIFIQKSSNALSWFGSSNCYRRAINYNAYCARKPSCKLHSSVTAKSFSHSIKIQGGVKIELPIRMSQDVSGDTDR